MHILIIEDEEQLCRSMAEGLRMDGYETDTCFDGEEGLELCMTENYDLILLDLNLPGIDGGPHKQWSMWFNSKQREEPYQVLTSYE